MFKEGDYLEITPDTKVGELLETYPFLMEKIVVMAPVFSKLQNPVLRKTIAKVTSIKQAAAVGGIDISFFLNTLRREVGQTADHGISSKIFVELRDKEVSKANVIYDARQDLDSGNPPAKKVLNDLKCLPDGQTYMVITPFYPAPMIDKAKEKGFTSKTYQIRSDLFETYFRKGI